MRPTFQPNNQAEKENYPKLFQIYSIHGQEVLLSIKHNEEFRRAFDTTEIMQTSITNRSICFPNEMRVFLTPKAKLLVVLTDSLKKLVLYPVDLESAMKNLR